MKDKTWRLVAEEFDKDVIGRTAQSDEFADGMMWASFAWGKKGPIHFLWTETADDKMALQHLLNVENAEAEPRCWIAFEFVQMIKEAELNS